MRIRKKSSKTPYGDSNRLERSNVSAANGMDEQIAYKVDKINEM